MNIAYTATQAWYNQLYSLISTGKRRMPRGKETLDLSPSHLTVDMRYPVVVSPERKLSYQFMAAEAHWILSGDDSVAGITPWNQRIAQFSDDGERFFGAYGPKVAGQLDYVVGKLKSDPSTRQAGLTIWRENPPETKDYPCTIAMWFGIDDNRHLQMFVLMRSSDVWLGLPYDIFSFSMVAHQVCDRLNEDLSNLGGFTTYPGNLHLTLVSSHLYQTNLEQAREVLGKGAIGSRGHASPVGFWSGHGYVIEGLRQLRDTKAGDVLRWWEP